MPTSTGFALETKLVGALPLVNHFLRRLGLEHFLEKHLAAPDPRTLLPPRQALVVLVRNLVLARVPLYGLGEWAAQRIPGLLGLRPEQVGLLNDDRVGRALDRLFDADRGALLTDVVVHMIREFAVALEQFHNDSTTLSLHGEYEVATGKLMRGKPTPRVTFGLSKDHRPDLKQLLWILTVSADGAVPVHFKVTHGNTEDSTTHRETWDVLRRLVGSPQFLYVADCKLCTRDNLKHIHDHGGQFITVLPRSRKEDQLFRDWLQQHTPAWEEVARKPHPRLRDGPPDIFRACPSPIPDADGFRVIWYQSSHKIARDAEARREAIQSAWTRLEALRARLAAPRPRWHARAAVAQATEKILGETGAARWIRYEVVPLEEAVFRQEKRGRPGKHTRWRRRLKTRFRLSWAPRQEIIDYDARCDGIFPLITNRKDEEASAGAVLEAYKSKQPAVEKRHDLLKNVQAATPMYLKNIGRMEALLFLEFVALMIHALIERQLRAAMKSRGISELPLYPEDRDCKAPSTDRVLEILEPLQRHLLSKNGQVVQRFDPELNELQRRILGFLGVSAANFANC
jgi:transposase